MAETNAEQRIDETWVEAVRRLAQLPPIEYDQVREQEAKALGSRPGTLDVEVKKARPTGSGNVDRAGAEVMFPECEPWPDYVDGAGLLNSIFKAAKAHLVLPVGAADAIALWVVHTHAHDASWISPVLAVTSPSPECGKSTLLTLLGALVPRPITASNITSAAIFRSFAAGSLVLRRMDARHAGRA